MIGWQFLTNIAMVISFLISFLSFILYFFEAVCWISPVCFYRQNQIAASFNNFIGLEFYEITEQLC